MKQDIDPQAIMECINREAIRDVKYRYCRAIDRVDVELLRTVFWPDAKIDLGRAFHGPLEEFISWAMPQLKSLEQTQHCLSNVYIRIQDATAFVESYYIAYHRAKKAEGDNEDIFVGGRYLDRMEKRQGEWRIALRDCAFDWYRVDKGMTWENYPFGQNLQYGTRKPHDAVFGLFGGMASTGAVAGFR